MKTTLLICILSLFAHAAKAQWLTDLPAALQRAQAEDKAVLINFTGSDWCGWCIRLKKEVFDESQFKAFAAENLILVEIDFPRGKKQPPALQQANQQLQAKYKVRGYPTVFLLDKNGSTLLQTGYQAGGAKKYIAHLTAVKGANWRTVRAAAPPVPPKPPQAAPAAAESRPPQAAPAQPEELVLKGIMGPENKRLALINNATFVAGETGRVKLGNKQVTVQCKTIGPDFVVVHVEGEASPRELKFQNANP